jgi:hypothetical protein
MEGEFRRMLKKIQRGDKGKINGMFFSINGNFIESIDNKSLEHVYRTTSKNFGSG